MKIAFLILFASASSLAQVRTTPPPVLTTPELVALDEMRVSFFSNMNTAHKMCGGGSSLESIWETPDFKSAYMRLTLVRVLHARECNAFQEKLKCYSENDPSLPKTIEAIENSPAAGQYFSQQGLSEDNWRPMLKMLRSLNLECPDAIDGCGF